MPLQEDKQKDVLDEFFSTLQNVEDVPQLPAVQNKSVAPNIEVDGDPVDFFNETAKQLVVKAHTDYLELSDQIQSGVVDPQVIHGAAQILASTNALLDTINKRELQKERFDHERWKIERGIEGKKEVNSHKATIKEQGGGDSPKTLIQYNQTINASREEIMNLLDDANTIVQDAEVEEIEDIKEI